MRPEWRHGIALSGVAFLLHAIWEFWQCPRFYIHGSLPPTVGSMIRVSIGDVGLTWVVQFVAATATRDWWWSFRRWGWREVGLLVGCAIALSFVIEWHALSTGRWGYTDAAPRVPLTEVSALPVLQLLLLFPVSFALAVPLSRFVPE